MEKQIRVCGFDAGPVVLDPGQTITWTWPDGTKILCLNDDGVFTPIKLTKTETVMKEYPYEKSLSG